ncbi:MAG: VCBS repeat-containing protein [Bacteroidales bacterium]|nr:VCBS repeat-containing protein [Bacteroidales bacterium]
MEKDNKSGKKNNKTFKNLIPFAIVIIVLFGLPLLFLNYQSKKSGLGWKDTLKRITYQKIDNNSDSLALGNSTTGEKIDFLIPEQAGPEFTEAPLISFVQASDLDRDGLMDIIACDCRSNTVSWIRQYPAGTYTETILADNLIAPAHTQVVDFDNDGDSDIMVAVLGMLFPNNDKIGSVVILENTGKNTFKRHIAAEKIARVSDVRAADLNNDGDMDLAVAQFGYDDGETRWIENLGNWKFESHVLQNLSGPINVEMVDVDSDGDLDIVSLVSQEWEEIWCFLNDGKANFQPKLLFKSSNQDFGSSAISMCDADLDGDQDILYTNGDAFDYIPPRGRPWHGIQWLENKGNLNFEFHRICDFIGVSNIRAADIDNDKDLDLFAVSTFNLWDSPESQSFIWLENKGGMQFITHNISNTPTHIIALDISDFNGDGQADIITGGMHTFPPFDRMGRVTLWINNGKLK